MPRSIPCLLAALGTALALGSFAEAATATGAAPCAAPSLSVLIPDEPQWAAASARLSAHLRALRDVDRCALVTVRPDGDGVSVHVTASDGREAERHADSVEELLTTAEALIALPPALAASDAAPRLPTAVRSSKVGADAMTPTTTRVEVGVAGAVRAGGAPAYLGAGIAAFAGFSLDHWLLALNARFDLVDSYRTAQATNDFQMRSTAVGVSAGRRWDVAPAALDALVGANVVLESQDSDAGPREIHGASGDFRFGLALRISSLRSGSIRPFAVGDVEASPGRLRSARYIDHSLPTLPWWSSGLAIGVSWGAR